MVQRVLVATRSFGSTSQAPWNVLRDAGVDYFQADMSQKMTEERLIDLLQDVDGAIVGLFPVTEHAMAKAPRLKVISVHGVGVDQIDLKAADRLGILVANCPGSNGQAVADLTIGLMIAVARTIPQADRQVRNGAWGSDFGGELWQKTLGLIGFGYIGRAVAERAAGFGMKILVFDPFVEPNGIDLPNIAVVPLQDLLQQSDFVSLHAALSSDNKEMIGPEELALMKPSAYLINTARGGLVDETALYEALRINKIAGAALDTFVNEPPTGSPLLTLENIVVTPHSGSHTKESIERMGVTSALNVVRTLQGDQPLHRVNMRPPSLRR